MGDTHISNLDDFEKAIKRKANPVRGYISKYGYTVSSRSLKSLKFFNRLRMDNKGGTGAKKTFKCLGKRLKYFKHLKCLLLENDRAMSKSAGNTSAVNYTGLSEHIRSISPHHLVVLHDVLVNPGLAEAQMTLLDVTDEIRMFSYIHRDGTKNRPAADLVKNFDRKYQYRPISWGMLLGHVLTSSEGELVHTANLLSQIYSMDCLSNGGT